MRLPAMPNYRPAGAGGWQGFSSAQRVAANPQGAQPVSNDWGFSSLVDWVLKGGAPELMSDIQHIF